MFFVGLDLGKRHDSSALVLVEKPERHPLSTVAPTLMVRGAQRAPLGMAFAEVVELARWMVAKANAAMGAGEARQCRLVVDATGLGLPVVEMLRRAQLPCQMTAVTITSGDRQHSRSGEGASMNVPKRDLIAGVQMALERGQLRIAKGMREAMTLRRELLDVRMNRRESGLMTYGANGYGQHDDLVIALALAVWRAGRF